MTAELISLAQIRAQRGPQGFPGPLQSPARRSRREAWLNASNLRQFAEAKRDLIVSIQSLQRHRLEAPALEAFAKLLALDGMAELEATPDHHAKAVEALRQALAAQIRTPAYNQECVRWKQAQWRRDGAQISRAAALDQSEFDRLIAADVAYLGGARRRAGAAS